VCLIQFSTLAADYIVDPIRLPDLSPLAPFFANPGQQKVFHAAEYDIICLRRDYHFEFTNIFDTMSAARTLGWPQVGLAAILDTHCHKGTQNMDAMLKRRGRMLEDLFFAEQDARLIAKQKELARMARTQQALADVSGITNQEVLRKLVELEISPDLLASLAVVPLVEVAWADGSVDEREQKAILDGAAGAGMGRGSVDYELLEEWLTKPPPASLLEAWVHYIAGLCEALSEQDRKSLEVSLLSRARLVAEAAGGFLGLVSRVSAREEAILNRMAKAFAAPSPT
jgi:hypothetical protein